jgi:photosystem II stability/assembly factor-like uncharacterized protein
MLRHRYCQCAVTPCAVLRHWGARRSGLRRTALLAAVALAATGCTATAHSGSPRTPHILGAPSGTPLVLGQPAPAGTGELGALSCATARRCWAVGVASPNAAGLPGSATVIVATKDGGRTWREQRVTGGSIPQLSGVSCPTLTDCIAVGSDGGSLPGSGVVVATTNAGATWNPVAAPAGSLTVLAVSCASATECLAIVNDGSFIWSATSTDLGHTWQRNGNMPSLFLPGDDLSCRVGGPCLVAGYVPTGTGTGEGAIARSADGGQTWSLASVPNGMGILRSAACATALDCLAAGSTSSSVDNVVRAKGALLRSTDGGRSWQPVAGPPPVSDVFDVECPSAAVCAMVGTVWKGNSTVGTGGVAQSGDGGRTFQLSSAAYVPLSLTALSCPTSTACFAAGGDSLARVTVAPPKPVHHPGGSNGGGTLGSG